MEEIYLKVATICSKDIVRREIEKSSLLTKISI